MEDGFQGENQQEGAQEDAAGRLRVTETRPGRMNNFKQDNGIRLRESSGYGKAAACEGGAAYLPGQSGNGDGGHQRETQQALGDEAKVPHSLGGHDLIQPAGPATLAQADPLAVAELAVKAPQADEEHQVADGPEERAGRKRRDGQVPAVQATEHLRRQNEEGHLQKQQREQGEAPPQAASGKERLPALGHGEAAEVDVEQRVANQQAEEAAQGVRVGLDLKV